MASQKRQRELNEERIFNESRQQALEERARQAALAKQVQQPTNQDLELIAKIDKQIELAEQADKRIMHKAPIERETDSIINTVTDFSPPKDWMED